MKGEVADALSAMLQEAMAESRAQTSVREIENMSDEWAQLLEDAGYDDLDSVINATVEDLTAIEGVDEETASQMIELARKHEQVDESGGESDEEESDEDSDESNDESDDESDESEGEESDEDTSDDEDSGEEASDEQKAEASVE